MWSSESCRPRAVKTLFTFGSLRHPSCTCKAETRRDLKVRQVGFQSSRIAGPRDTCLLMRGRHLHRKQHSLQNLRSSVRCLWASLAASSLVAQISSDMDVSLQINRCDDDQHCMSLTINLEAQFGIAMFFVGSRFGEP